MAEQPDENSASFKLMVDPNPDKDELVIYIHYRNVWVRVQWKDSEQQDVKDLFSQKDPLWFLERGHLEYEVHREAAVIDNDLSKLFPTELETCEGCGNTAPTEGHTLCTDCLEAGE